MMNQFRVYRASKTGGAASAFNLSINENGRNNCVFWKAALQDGIDENDNAKFHWDNREHSVNAKLGPNDIGAILAVLRGKIGAVGGGKGLFHANSKGNTVIRFQFVEKDDRAYYAVGLSTQRDGQKVEVKHTVSLEEGEVLESLLSAAVVLMYGWYPQPEVRQEQSQEAL